MLDLALKYWPAIAVPLILVGPYLFNKLKAVPSLFKNKKAPPVKVDVGAVQNQDIEAIRWLTNRAVDIQDKSLILEMESVNTKFFNIHCAMRKPDSSTI